MAEALGLPVITEDWPHGLRCAECHRELGEGDRYSERLDSLIGDTPAVLIVCIGCALTPSPDTLEGEK